MFFLTWFPPFKDGCLPLALREKESDSLRSRILTQRCRSFEVQLTCPVSGSPGTNISQVCREPVAAYRHLPKRMLHVSADATQKDTHVNGNDTYRKCHKSGSNLCVMLVVSWQKNELKPALAVEDFLLHTSPDCFAFACVAVLRCTDSRPGLTIYH